MLFARRVFQWAGILGILSLAPFLFLERRIGQDLPPPINHPEYFYGFLAVALAWQIAFLIIGRDPVRFRPLMPAAMVEKFGFVGVSFVLYALGRVPGVAASAAVFDLIWAVLFVVAYWKTPEPSAPSAP